jgi:hypothetical protein
VTPRTWRGFRTSVESPLENWRAKHDDFVGRKKAQKSQKNAPIFAPRVCGRPAELAKIFASQGFEISTEQ